MDIIYGVKYEDRHNLTIKKAWLVNEFSPLIIDTIKIINQYLFDVSSNNIGFSKIEIEIEIEIEIAIETETKYYYGVKCHTLKSNDITSYNSITPVKSKIPKSIIKHSRVILNEPCSHMTTWKTQYFKIFIIYGVIINELNKTHKRNTELFNKINNDIVNSATLLFLNDSDDINYYLGYIVKILPSENNEISLINNLTKKYIVENYDTLDNKLNILLKTHNLTAKSLPMLIQFNV